MKETLVLIKNSLVLLSAIAFFLAAAWYRPGDSGHAMGVLSRGGGRARHPVQLPGGGHRYTLVVTGTVQPPYRGDARIVVEGSPALSYAVQGSDPVVDLGLRHHPSFDGSKLSGLRPRDRFTVWIVMRSGPGRSALHGRYSVAFYDVADGRPVLRIPVVFAGEEASCHED